MPTVLKNVDPSVGKYISHSINSAKQGLSWLATKLISGRNLYHPRHNSVSYNTIQFMNYASTSPMDKLAVSENLTNKLDASITELKTTHDNYKKDEAQHFQNQALFQELMTEIQDKVNTPFVEQTDSAYHQLHDLTERVKNSNEKINTRRSYYNNQVTSINRELDDSKQAQEDAIKAIVEDKKYDALFSGQNDPNLRTTTLQDLKDHLGNEHTARENAFKAETDTATSHFKDRITFLNSMRQSATPIGGLSTPVERDVIQGAGNRLIAKSQNGFGVQNFPQNLTPAINAKIDIYQAATATALTELDNLALAAADNTIPMATRQQNYAAGIQNIQQALQTAATTLKQGVAAIVANDPNAAAITIAVDNQIDQEFAKQNQSFTDIAHNSDQYFLDAINAGNSETMLAKGLATSVEQTKINNAALTLETSSQNNFNIHGFAFTAAQQTNVQAKIDDFKATTNAVIEKLDKLTDIATKDIDSVANREKRYDAGIEGLKKELTTAATTLKKEVNKSIPAGTANIAQIKAGVNTEVDKQLKTQTKALETIQKNNKKHFKKAKDEQDAKQAYLKDLATNMVVDKLSPAFKEHILAKKKEQAKSEAYVGDPKDLEEFTLADLESQSITDNGYTIDFGKDGRSQIKYPSDFMEKYNKGSKADQEALLQRDKLAFMDLMIQRGYHKGMEPHGKSLNININVSQKHLQKYGDAALIASLKAKAAALHELGFDISKCNFSINNQSVNHRVSGDYQLTKLILGQQKAGLESEAAQAAAHHTVPGK